jgi:hypothetical protein
VGLLTKIFGGGGEGVDPSTERPSRQGRPLESTVAPKNPAPPPPLQVPRSRTPLIVSPRSLTPEELVAPTGRSPLPTMRLDFALHGPRVQGSREHGSREQGARTNGAVAGAAALPEPSVAALPAPAIEVPELEPEPEELQHALDGAIELLVDFAYRLALGPLSEEWMVAGAEAARALKQASRGGWQPHLLASFEALERLLAEGARTRALPVVWRLSDSVPEWPAAARNLRETARGRERRVVSELLASVDGLRARARASLAQEKPLAHLTGATPELLATELGTPVERARELARIVALYEAERRASPIDLRHQAALRQAIIELDRCQREFESRDEDLRELRQQRRQALRRVNLLLAERGDLGLLDELEPLSVSERVERLSTLIGLGAGERA